MLTKHLQSTTRRLLCSGFVAVISLASHLVCAAEHYYTVQYDASTQEQELQLGVTYTLWLPPNVKKLRGVIVHQHGCGVGACKGGETAAYDLHWQALAAKWDCALLGPSYHQGKEQSCRLWCDPRNGSQQTFLNALSDFAQQSKHPELTEVPWCLWGHSGGAFWASLMKTLYPERIAAVWLRSGGAIVAWEKGEIPVPEIPAAAFGIPTMCNPGAKEKEDARFSGAWTNAMKLFELYKKKNAPICFAPDPRTAHECGDSRYLAIPFFDACLGLRLPATDTNKPTLRPIDMQSGWLAPLLGTAATLFAKYTGDKTKAVWLPTADFAKAWSEYVQTGAVSDQTPPPAPHHVQVKQSPQKKETVITWQAEADFESGIGGFLIQRDGETVGQIPTKPQGRFGRPLFQSMSYHDTPNAPLPEMRFVDPEATPGQDHSYQVLTINSTGLKSTATAPAKQK